MAQLSAHAPIGIFDSGIGGLTIAHELIKQLPNEDVIYFGDTAHLPYGDKSDELVRHYATEISRFLINKGCKLIVIACNTASSVAYDHLVATFPGISIVNVVDPLVKGIYRRPDIKKVGIIGTKTTIHSGVYTRKLKELNPAMLTVPMATPLLAPMIEEGFFNNRISRTIVENYLKDEQFSDIDAMALACTHYPLIKKDIEQFYNQRVKVFDSTDFIAAEVKTLLQHQNLLSDRKHNRNHFYVSDFTESFEQTTRFFFKEEIELEFCPLWES